MSVTMPSPPAGLDLCTLEARRLASAALAEAFRDSRTPGVPPVPVHAGSIRDCWTILRARHADIRPGDLGLGELAPARADAEPLIAWLRLGAPARAAVFDRVFGLVVSRECPAYETEYCASRDAFHRSQHMADLTGFFRAFGVRPDPAHPQRADHAPNHLAFVAFLLQKLASMLRHPGDPLGAEHAEVCTAALASFVNDHVIWWMPTFARCLSARIRRLSGGERRAEAPGLAAFAGVSDLLRCWVAVERLESALPPHRRIEIPAIEEPDPEPDSCGSCAGCADPRTGSAQDGV